VRYFLDISYKGTNYHGWQVQPNAISVQEVLEKSLQTLFQQKIELTGSGRTDTGVHATQQIAHLDIEIRNIPDFIYKLNAILPNDISINNCHPVLDSSHARFDANKRSYQYFIHTHKNPFLTDISYYFKKSLDIDSIQEACKILTSWTDFETFSKVKTDVKTFNCRIFKADWQQTDHGYLFEITADRFLRGMVRAIVGTLLEIGEGKLSLQEFALLEEKKNRSLAGRSVPAHGLFLNEVCYPNNIFKN